MKKTPRSPNLWHVPDPLWDEIKPLLQGEEPSKTVGRPRVDQRLVLDGILFRLRTGCQWNHIPPVYGSDTTLHRYFLQWVRSGVFEKVWSLILRECPELGTVVWDEPGGGRAQPSPGGKPATDPKHD